ncbi:MAG: Ig-like domain-containing protein [Candidatus Coatesbacteria bacterium]|nr:Ig-like domain-containing protein [Candidatus Coatesbacteria bacterium]
MNRVLVLVIVLVSGLLLVSSGYASRCELGYDLGTRNIMEWHVELATPLFFMGLATKFTPPAWPCTIREARVYVDSTAQCCLGILDSNGQFLVEPATVSAVQPVSWATRDFPGGVRIEAGDFYVLVEYPAQGHLAIARTEMAFGQEARDWPWRSQGGLRAVPLSTGAVLIRATVDLPVNVKIDPGLVRNQHIFAYFDSAMDPSTLNDATVTLGGQSALAGQILYDQALMRLEFIPQALLDTGQGLHFTISTDVRDVYGNQLALAASDSVFVEGRVDDTAPAAPLDLKVVEENMALGLSWQAGIESDVRGHFAYWGPYVPGASDQDWLASAQKIDVGEKTSTRLEPQANDALYRVGVSTYDCCRNESAVSFATGVAHRGPELLLVEAPLPPYMNDQGVAELSQAMSDGCFDFTLWDEAQTGALPGCPYLEQFNSMFWALGDRLYTLNSGSWELMQDFMRRGGALYYEAHFTLGSSNRNDSFLPDWLRIYWEYGWGDFDAAAVVGLPGDPIGDGVELLAATPRAASISYFEPTQSSLGFLTVEGKEKEVCGLRYRDAGQYGYSLVFSTTNMAQTYDLEQRSKLMSRGLCWLERKELDFRIAASTRVLQRYSVLQLFVSANTLAGVEADADAYLAVLVEADGGSALLFYDGAGFVSEMRPFVSGVHLDSGMFLPRTKIFEYLYRGGLPSGKYTFFAALMQAGTQTFLTDARSTVVFIE